MFIRFFVSFFYLFLSFKATLNYVILFSSYYNAMVCCGYFIGQVIKS